MSKKHRTAREKAFLEDIKAVEQKHQMQLAYFQPPVEVRFVNMGPAEVSRSARRQAEKLAGTYVPWWKRLFKPNENRTTPQIQDGPGTGSGD